MDIKNIFKQDLTLPDKFKFEVLLVGKPLAVEAGKPAGKPKNYKFNSLHFHDVIEIDVITAGEGLFLFDNTVFQIQAGDIYIVNAFENHTCTSESLNLACIHFNPYTLIGNVFTDSEYAEIFKNGTPVFSNLIRGKDEDAEKVKAILHNIISEWSSQKEGYRPMIRLLLGELLLILNRSYRKSISVESDDSVNASAYQRIREVLDHIHSNFQYKLTLDELAQKALMHKTYFSAFFKKATGYTVTDYITNIRINTACNLLKASTLSIKEISSICGFNTVSNFNKAFKKTVSKTPQEFRSFFHE